MTLWPSNSQWRNTTTGVAGQLRIESLPCLLAARDIAPRAASTCSPYRIGICVDFHLPACMVEARSIFSDRRSCVAPTLMECPLILTTSSAARLIHRPTRLKISAIISTCSRGPIVLRPTRLRNITPSPSSAVFIHCCRCPTVSRDR
jgi:hypothetical protein